MPLLKPVITSENLKKLSSVSHEDKSLVVMLSEAENKIIKKRLQGYSEATLSTKSINKKILETFKETLGFYGYSVTLIPQEASEGYDIKISWDSDNTDFDVAYKF